MPWSDAQLSSDLAVRQSKSAKAMCGHEAVQAQIAVWMGAELIDKREFAIAPSLGFGQHAFDERP
ncbi:MAG TPA: hypothetical protein VGX27_00970 [Candidatus Dormibacteraeota bacterium]|nr:hypothetical protein [Candidatus Dormibacteraeota bacterium]